MLKIYRNIAIAALLLIIFTALLVYGSIVTSNTSTSLFPTRDLQITWAPDVFPSQPIDNTFLSVKNDIGMISYDFFLDPDKPHPYTHYSFYFTEPKQPYTLVDLSGYSSVSFKMLCNPQNVLLFVLFSFDEKVTNLADPVTRRVSSKAFACDTEWKTFTIGFNELDPPHWWLDKFGYKFSDGGYQLNKTMGLAFANSLQSPKNQLSHVRFTDVQLLGREYGYIYAAVAISLSCWGLFLVWLFRQYLRAITDRVKEKLQLDQPLFDYKKLTLEPQKDKDRNLVLKHLATEYANPDLSLESATVSLGINRTKINDILKDELGLTFKTYLNKLRLTEAARLLSEKKDANVSEIAYFVGYNNASYFNKLFKMEYGCTPKTFKAFCQTKECE